ncbi:MAG: glycoside hydrolase family 15 protein [Blastocatellia bacterium]|nr:glycoside hydrolase family 15 protein [Blastocatellia bacterium]
MHDIPTLNHGAIGNGRVLGLISPTSAIEWLCLPRFDSGSVFGRILDREQGGTFRILADGEELVGTLRYITNTNVLATRFEDRDTTWEVIDFAPRLPRGLTVEMPIEIVRLVRPVKGHPKLRIDFDPRPDYARARVELAEITHGIEVSGDFHRLHLSTNLPLAYILGKRPFRLDQPVFFVLTYGRREHDPTLAEVQHNLELTIQGWRAWARTCALPMFGAEAVLRSALCLKLHVYEDTGAIIAAATTSIPEAPGTQRTWDYRYCWLRDAAFVVEALRRLSHLNEGEKFLHFLWDVAESGPLQPLYGIDGRRELEEIQLPHLAGFAGTKPVRIGNAAAEQRQNDLVGELVLCLETLLSDPRLIVGNPEKFIPLIERLVEEAIHIAPTPDTSIWEFRTKFSHYTFSRAMCWVAIHRGAELALHFNRPDLAERWAKQAAIEREIVLSQGFNLELGYFTQNLGGKNPDAANLLLPTLGLLDARDPRFISTIEAYRERLMVGSLVLRYRTEDDFGETTSAFTICSFWMAEALALAGKLDEAMEMFQFLLKFQNPVGLFSEDIDPQSGQLLGNFPQAYTHVGLIHAAMTIGSLLEARDGKVRAWA